MKAKFAYVYTGHPGFFTPCYFPNDEWNDDLADKFRFVGQFVALALFNDVRITLKLSRPVIKHLLRKPVNWHDLAFFSTEKYEKYRKIIADPESWILPGETMFDIDLKGDGLSSTPLKAGGSSIEVTRETALEFAELSARTLLTTSIEKPLNAMRDGFEVWSIIAKCYRMCCNHCNTTLLKLFLTL